MKILTDTLELSSSHQAGSSQSYSVQEESTLQSRSFATLFSQFAFDNSKKEGVLTDDNSSATLSSDISGSNTAARLENTENSFLFQNSSVTSSSNVNLFDLSNDPRERQLQLLKSLIDTLISVLRAQVNSSSSGGKNSRIALPSFAVDDEISAGSGQALYWRKTVCCTTSEYENTNLCGSGTVQTCDGKSLDFDFSFNMDYQYQTVETESASGIIELQDPLVLSFDGKACELSDQMMCFDLDADGQFEQIPSLKEGSAFLVFDRNQNGMADDGLELFGAKTGLGFQELCEYDDDGNGWIDESDPIWQQLALWSSSGFSTLQEKNVGALSLKQTDAPFSLKNQDNELLGQIREASIFLEENGKIGLLQQVDLVKS